MPIPNNGLITENNRQYYEGAQGFIGDDVTMSFLTTFNTDLIFGGPDAWDPNNINYALNNFKLYTSLTAQPGTFEEYVLDYEVIDNAIVFPNPPEQDLYIVVQLKKVRWRTIWIKPS